MSFNLNLLKITYLQCFIFFHFVDFRFYNDPSDEFREGVGTLLPLWKFSYGKFKHIEITGLCWNSAYKDLFVASLGSCKTISTKLLINIR